MNDELSSDSSDADLLAALLALDALDATERTDAERRLDTWPLEQAAVVVPLAEAVATEPPTHLRGDVLAAALARRPAGRPVNPPEPLLPAEAFRRTIDE